MPLKVFLKAKGEGVLVVLPLPLLAPAVVVVPGPPLRELIPDVVSLVVVLSTEGSGPRGDDRGWFSLDGDLSLLLLEGVEMTSPPSPRRRGDVVVIPED